MTGRADALTATGVPSGRVRGTAAALAAAQSSVKHDPALWLLGALSFCVRGGVLLILLPILWVPSPVLLSVFFGRYLTTSGISPDAVPVALSVGLGAGLAVIAAVALAAYAQLSSFERIACGAETRSLLAGRAPRALHGRERGAIVLRLTLLNLASLVPVLLLLPVIGAHIGDAGLAELQLPSSTDTPFVMAVLGRVQSDLLILAGVVVVMDVLAALAAHQLLAARLGVAPLVRRTSRHPDLRALATGLARIVKQPFRTLFVLALSWMLTIGALAVALAATIIGWDTLRSILFQATPADAGQTLIALFVRLFALAVFGAIWVASITLVGFASSLRGAFWTTNALH